MRVHAQLDQSRTEYGDRTTKGKPEDPSPVTLVPPQYVVLGSRYSELQYVVIHTKLAFDITYCAYRRSALCCRGLLAADNLILTSQSVGYRLPML